MTDFYDSLVSVVGRAHVLRRPGQMRRFTTGYRTGSGTAAAVVRPGTLVELWRTLKICVDAGVAIIMQAANTGLTGGSTPTSDGYDRPIILINTMRIDVIHVIDQGRQVICLPGARLNRLERVLAPLHREPHSVIGSSCIGASVVGGVCNSSGGALVRRGSAYTELAMFAKVEVDGRLVLVNHLGIDLGRDPEEMLVRLQEGDIQLDNTTPSSRVASNQAYSKRVRDLDAPVPARFNADPTALYEASGSAGKVAVFAVRLDTFPKDMRTETFYLGTNDPAEFSLLRRRLLTEARYLPVSAEYIHRDAFDLARKFGRDTIAAIKYLGTDRIPLINNIKARLDGLLRGRGRFDRVLQSLSRLLPDQLPPRMAMWSESYRHHLILTLSDDGIEEASDILDDLWPSSVGGYFKCTQHESKMAYLYRFSVAGAAIRYRAVYHRTVSEVLSLDIAYLPADDLWHEPLHKSIDGVTNEIVYGHFMCNVFHKDYLISKNADMREVKRKLLTNIDERSARYPAEHNVGHLYEAAPELIDLYRNLDPLNIFNPGIGKTSKLFRWN